MSDVGEKVRIGIIGVGQIGTRHLQRYRDIEGVEVVGASDLFPQRLAARAAEFDIPDTYADFKDLLARDDIRAVDVCVHNNKHAPVTIAALEAGKDVYCEKPMAGAYADAEAMYETARRLGRRLSIQLASLFSMDTKLARRLIDDGHLGTLYYARSVGYRRRGRPFVDGYGSPTFVDKAISAGGALFDMGVYHIANMLYLLGNPEVQTVTGSTHQELEMYPDRREFSGYSVEELGLGWARLAGGITLDVEEAWAVHHDGTEASKVLGGAGGIRLNPLTFFSSMADAPAVTTFDLGGTDRRWHACLPDTDAYDSPQHHWAAVLQGRVELLPTAEIALNTALISEGIYMSGRQGREVTADEIRTNSVSTAIDPYTQEKVWA